MKKRNEKNIIRIISDPNIRRLGEDTRRPFINRFHFLQRKPNKEGYQKTDLICFGLSLSYQIYVIFKWYLDKSSSIGTAYDAMYMGMFPFVFSINKWLRSSGDSGHHSTMYDDRLYLNIIHIFPPLSCFLRTPPKKKAIYGLLVSFLIWVSPKEVETIIGLLVS
ncbi:hypothetical protein RIR_jg7231.t5 [Rhizophagus irregularis DAOM 181602=DAOM 197198]|nr:hypothetical protein RIR_jg7231.t5 [Rhizophagus irregularis DAOM 181602=DAOM 197198]